MHKKFKEKMALDDLLNEIEQAAQEIEGIYFASKHLFDYCNDHSDIEQIKNMTYIVETLKNNLYCLSKELSNIISNQKYHNTEFFENLNISYADNIIYEDD